MKCCDLSAEVTSCLLNETGVSGPCETCPLAEKLSGRNLMEILEELEKEVLEKEELENDEFEETLI